ncbi:MAG: methyl-accepting chemotaxis protein [Phormidesmis sp.]
MFNTFLKKISTRLLLSYSVPLFCLGGLGLFVYSSAQKTFALEMQRDLINQSNYAANSATYYLADSVRKVQGSLLKPDESSEYRASYISNYNLFLASLGGLEALAIQQQDDELKALTESLRGEGDRIDQEAQVIFSKIDQQALVEAVALLNPSEADRVDSSRQALLMLIDQRLTNNAADFEIARQQLAQIILWGTATAGLITVAIGILLARQIRGQMRKLVNVVEQNGIQVTTASTQIAASSRQLEASVSEQATSTTEITATTQEIAATAEGLSQTMEAVVTLSDSAAAGATMGKQALEQMAQTIRQLIAATATISSKLGLIDDKANNISVVVTAITKVADQTNLLSLNAAIEAEKAGEYGAGFAVVAREIRRLADQTAIATLDIENMVKEMLSSVSSGVMEMDKFSQEVEENAQNISQISEQMGQIITQVQSLVPQFETVSDGMTLQAQGAQQIRAAMEQLNDTSLQTADSVKETHQVIAQLGDVAQDLQAEVAKFRLAV